MFSTHPLTHPTSLVPSAPKWGNSRHLTHLLTAHSGYSLHPRTVPAVFAVTSPNSLRPRVYYQSCTWRAGQLIGDDVRLTRSSWGVWVLVGQLQAVLPTPASVYLHRWILRTRRLLSAGTPAPYLVINAGVGAASRPARRIKRWLKKRYSAGAWR